MKTTFGLLLILTTTMAVEAKTIDLRGKRLQGLKLNYANTLQLEQTIRQQGSPGMDTKKIEVKFECIKKWKVRGRDDTLTYQCNPIEIEVPN